MRLLFCSILILDAPFFFFIDSLTRVVFISCNTDEGITRRGSKTRRNFNFYFYIRFLKLLSFRENSLSKEYNQYIYICSMENMVDREILSFVHRFIVRTIIRSVLSGLLIVPLCYTHLKRSTLFLVKQCPLYSLSRNDV